MLADQARKTAQYISDGSNSTVGFRLDASLRKIASLGVKFLCSAGLNVSWEAAVRSDGSMSYVECAVPSIGRASLLHPTDVSVVQLSFSKNATTCKATSKVVMIPAAIPAMELDAVMAAGESRAVAVPVEEFSRVTMSSSIMAQRFTDAYCTVMSADSLGPARTMPASV